jgi:hypothetical protein
MSRIRATQAAATGGSAGGRMPPEARRISGLLRMSAVSGIGFAVLFGAALVLLREAPGLGVPDSAYTAFYRDSGGGVLVTVGLYLVPFAGIAFLWQLAATRALLNASAGAHQLPSEIPRLLQLASGVLFVAMLFAGSAAVGAVALLGSFSVDPLPSPEVARALAATGYGLLFVFGVRAAGMYMITTTTLGRAVGLFPRWVAVVGYLAAAFLLVSTTFHPAILLVFPIWTVLVSGVLLVRAGYPNGPSPH